MLHVIIHTKHMYCDGMILKITKIKGVRENHTVSIWSSEVMRGQRKLLQNSKSVQDCQVSGLVDPCVSQKEQVQGTGSVASLKWNGGESTTHSGLRTYKLRLCLECMIEKLNLTQHAHKGHQTGRNEATIDKWHQEWAEEITIILDTRFILCKKGMWIKVTHFSKIYTIKKVSWSYIKWCTHNLIYMPNVEN
jgi:hypothetical protein